MKSFLFLYALVALLFWSVPSVAQSACEIRSTQDILDCALNRHPDVAVSRAARDRDLKLKDLARQRPNPELTSKIVGGVETGDGVLDTETSLLHVLELGGKRKSRLRRAEAGGYLAAAGLQGTVEEVALTTVLSLRRLGQIRTEQAYLRESVSTFQRILQQLGSRPSLTPEQSVSSTVFEIAKEEYRLKERVLIEEETVLQKSLEVATSLSYGEMKPYLPASKRTWPKMTETADTDSTSAMKRAEAEKKLAEAELKAAKSQSWPDLKIGPTIETSTAGPGGNTLFGGTVALPLPVLNLNRGGRRFAEAEKARADLNLRVTGEKIAKEREKQLIRYREAVKALSMSRSHADMAAGHKGVDDLFERGMVSGALVIESHRQMVEIQKSLHERELAALDALWRLYILDGRLEEARL